MKKLLFVWMMALACGASAAEVAGVKLPDTMKLGSMKALLPESLKGADEVFCYANSLGWNAAEALAPLGDKARVFDELETLVQGITTAARPGDQILVMSNGGFGGVHDKLLRALAG